MKTLSFVLAAIATVCVFGSVALADPLGPPPYAGPDAVSPYQVMNMARASGFRPLGPPIRRGRVYVLRAVDVDGEDVGLVIDASSGRLVSTMPSGRLPPDYGAASAYQQTPPMDEPGAPYQRPNPYQSGPYQSGPYQSGPYQSGPYQSGPYRYGAPEPMPGARGPYTAPMEPAPAARPAAPIAPAVRSAAVTPRTPLPRPRPTEPVVGNPTDAKIAAPEPQAQSSPPQASAAGKDSVGQEKPVQEKSVQEKPVDKPAEKPAATTLPPVAPLD